MLLACQDSCSAAGAITVGTIWNMFQQYTPLTGEVSCNCCIWLLMKMMVERRKLLSVHFLEQFYIITQIQFPYQKTAATFVTLTSASLHQQIKYTILRLHQSLYNFIQTGVLSENKKLSGRIKAEAMMSSLLQLQPQTQARGGPSVFAFVIYIWMIITAVVFQSAHKSNSVSNSKDPSKFCGMFSSSIVLCDPLVSCMCPHQY